MTKAVESLLQEFEKLSPLEQRQLFESIEDYFDGALADQSLREFQASGSKGISAQEAFALARKGTCATE